MDVKELFNKGYADFYAGYNQHQLDAFDTFEAPWIIPYLPTKRDAAILDIGCGPGLMLGYLWRLGYWQILVAEGYAIHRNS